jgi:Fur family peroxide stress response transcriptional regulator
MALDRYRTGLDALRAAGLKLTPQRLAVLECLSGDETHPTAQELHERLRKKHPTMSVATVYNTLSALDAIGYCRRIELGGSSRFDPNVELHDHALCERCGAMRDVAPSPSQAQPERLRALPGWEVSRVERIYRGLCARCARAA